MLTVITLVFQLMSKYESWGMNLFLLTKVVDDRPLTAITYTIFKVRPSNPGLAGQLGLLSLSCTVSNSVHTR